ncbi:hypothetical protein Q6344_09150 [Psychrobacter cibarius]|nr:hypothetical protein Q6344_09150 [Psychrobacter cibarius]
MPKIKYVGAHDSYTVADIAFKKGVAIDLADDQIAKVKNNGIGAKLFANGDLVVDKAANKTVVNPDLKPAPKATVKADAKTEK